MLKLIKGDCLSVMKDLPEGSVDMVLCDLPYGITACKWDSIIPFNALWEQYNRIIKKDGAVVLFSAQPFTTKLIHSNFNNYRYNWYWKKNNVTGGQFAKVQPMRCIEDVCVFYQKKPTYNPQGLVKLATPLKKSSSNSKIYSWGGDKNYTQHYTNYPKHLIEFSKDRENYHPTQKPIKLLEYLVKTYTNEGDTVLDNCMGSGSTGIACLNTGRRFIGIEKAPNYFDIACTRLGEWYMNDDNKAA